MPSTSVIWALEQAIFNELSADVEIAANVVGVYHMLPDNSNRPFIYLNIDRVEHISTVLSVAYKVTLSVHAETGSRSSEKLLSILERIGELLHHNSTMTLSEGSIISMNQVALSINRNDEKEHNVIGSTRFEIFVE